MKTKEFDYFLPKKLIAQKPIRPRDHSRLMVLERKKKKIIHDFFFNLGSYLRKGDGLIFNNTSVIPAKLIGQKPTGGRIEILLVKKVKRRIWECLIRGKIKNKKLKINIKKNKKNLLIAELKEKLPTGSWLVRFDKEGKKFKKIIEKIGLAPTPPYIKRISNLKEYQTIYARKKGSIAAPTAGFHFTQKLIKYLKEKGIKLKFITLHLGLGTFQPIKTEEIEKHKMSPEYVIINKRTAEEINKIKEKGGRIIAIGTSTARALESVAEKGKIYPFKGWVNLFIKPGYRFKFIDGLITNFHLPKSTNLVLVSSFAGKDFIFKAYQKAIKKGYRFYSFGDAMLII
ncbi:MAG: tRNA preQ1(34) S-adenosylmethionine ribosyltransferase-isomerase QueA [Patescibacteria group bacterium]